MEKTEEIKEEEEENELEEERDFKIEVEIEEEIEEMRKELLEKMKLKSRDINKEYIYWSFDGYNFDILIDKEAMRDCIMDNYVDKDEVLDIEFFEDTGVAGEYEKGFDYRMSVLEEIKDYINELIGMIVDIVKKYQTRIKTILNR